MTEQDMFSIVVNFVAITLLTVPFWVMLFLIGHLLKPRNA